ncbi:MULTISPECIES: gamma subclass chorismate mutase AroQ [Pseudomonas]|jgi:chorismate mutase|uniref:gamma subclass chorismate mutase AroQ n=1 Tax=Pseudomonas TaxID=286 RepID=UPI002093AAA3|nr:MULTISPECIES: gamma subclass chorismate mutase AroQ [Pseudomonas]USS55709.1 gamma subclass chorismate mutase AroQ [Pseudomonas kermanshahensis]UVL66589.1 gamma subclass chorismate mutase AroQ [Pseudomonas sp. B21-031]
MRLALPALPCLSLALLGCSASTPYEAEFAPLLANIEYRLDLATSVALHKYDHNLPVEAPAREQQVITQVRQQVADHDLSPDRAAAFFSDQIEANKLVQYALLDRWTTLGQRPSAEPLDLVDQLRPRLDKLQATLLFELGRFDRQPPTDCARKLADALNSRTNDPLRHLAMVRATGQLCPKR